MTKLGQCALDAPEVWRLWKEKKTAWEMKDKGERNKFFTVKRHQNADDVTTSCQFQSKTRAKMGIRPIAGTAVKFTVM